MVRFNFGGPLDRDALISLVRVELETRRNQVARFRTRDRSIKDLRPIDGVDIHLVQRLSDLGHEHGASAIDHWIAWLQRVLDELEQDHHLNRTKEHSA
ncbi:hypothetical protein GCM10011575_09420 [Microlunatus endophyticus]|uniref:Transcription regulator PadR C-terminal domain-containing protein n=1 Tax=Microlunatus endophyticus TaxID=1716077 RepID=A0A917S2I0_9ACTN|nr:hypothetical protein [Microlunatus endophyticus]GGL53144.1 hypothetical protein GCM10011575_09420 [Microlunatus endophyticus]